MEHSRDSLKIKKSKKKKKLKPHELLQKFLRKKYDDPKEVSKFGEISKARKAREEAYKKAMEGM